MTSCSSLFLVRLGESERHVGFNSTRALFSRLTISLFLGGGKFVLHRQIYIIKAQVHLREVILRGLWEHRHTFKHTNKNGRIDSWEHYGTIVSSSVLEMGSVFSPEVCEKCMCKPLCTAILLFVWIICASLHKKQCWLNLKIEFVWHFGK